MWLIMVNISWDAWKNFWKGLFSYSFVQGTTSWNLQILQNFLKSENFLKKITYLQLKLWHSMQYSNALVYEWTQKSKSPSHVWQLRWSLSRSIALRTQSFGFCVIVKTHCSVLIKGKSDLTYFARHHIPLKEYDQMLSWAICIKCMC